MKTTHTTRTIALCALIALLFVASGLRADDEPDFERFSGVKVGMNGAGDVKIEGVTGDQSTGYNLCLFADFPAGGRIYYGSAIQVLRMKWSVHSDSVNYEESETLLDIGITMKAFIGKPDRGLVVRPGFKIGYGTMRRRGTLNGTNYLTLQAMLELMYLRPNASGFLIDAGVWSVPSGGDSEVDINVGPLAFFRIGMTF